MSIKFIYGRSGSGKSYYCLNSIKRKIEKGNLNSNILIVPEQFSFQTEKNMIESIGHHGLLKCKVFSFKRLANAVLNEVGGGVRKHINDSGKNILLYKIISENREKLKVFKKGWSKQGFVSNMGSTIKELKKFNIKEEDLKESIDRIENPTFKSKLEDIMLIFSEFQNRLSKNYIDDEDELTILINNLEKSSIFDGAEVWVDEFSSFTPQEYKILEKIMKRAKKVNFTLCMDFVGDKIKTESTDLFFPIKVTEQKLLEIAKNNNISYEKPVVLNSNPCRKFKGRSELQHMEHNLFSYPYSQYNYKPQNIKLFKALNKYSEIENVASDIVRICRDKGFRFKDIAVVTGDLDGYQSIIKAVFNEYNIPCFIDKKRDIDDNPIIVLIISAVEIISKNWSYESVFRYLKTGLLDIENEDIDVLENYVLENGIKGNKWLMEDKWEFNTSYSAMEDKAYEDIKNQLLDRINTIRDRVRTPLIKLASSIKGRKSGREKCEGLYNFLCDINIPEKVEEIIRNFREESRLDKANEYNQIWNIVVDTMDQVVDTIGDDVFSIDTFGKVLVSGFKQYKIGVIPPSLDQVLVGDILRIRSHDIKALYIVGASDGVFPPSITSDGIFTDGDREELLNRGIELRSSSRYRAFEEQFIIYKALTLADRYLRISYPMGDDSGKTMRPSIIVSRLKKLFLKIEEESDAVSKQSSNEIDLVSVPSSTFNKLIENITVNSAKNNIDPLWIDVYSWYCKDKKWNSKLEKVLQGAYYTNEMEIADTKKVRKLYGKHLNVSVSRLEKFAQCPFAYFVQYGLKAKERKIYNLTPPDIGSFMHNVLQNFSVKLKEQNLTWSDVDKKWCKENTEEIVREILSERPNSILNSSKRYKHITSRIERVLTRASYLISEHIKKGKFTPKGYEVSFGKDGYYPPISVELHSGEEVNLSGRVDRIDIMEKDGKEYIRVIDYKSGSKEFDISDVYYGLQIQLLVYLDVILSELEEKFDGRALPAGILYFKLDDPIVMGTEDMSYKEIETRIKKSLKMNGLILDDIDVIKDMDSSISGSSEIIPVSVKKNGEVSYSRSSVAKEEQFQMLRKYVRVTMERLCERILEGDIEISPYMYKSRSGCDFCIYSPICQFDTLIKGNSYNIFKKKNIEEVWRDIESTVSDE
ncbi:helicase-exonuclease AddAB subunit AddB [Clostridium sp.]|uniref:helicase-exonuclease AddAB subunit AddB n=1 Tax=Clostridium sp. TaxID=1506 RepID=UPI003A5C0482